MITSSDIAAAIARLPNAGNEAADLVALLSDYECWQPLGEHLPATSPLRLEAAERARAHGETLERVTGFLRPYAERRPFPAFWTEASALFGTDPDEQGTALLAALDGCWQGDDEAAYLERAIEWRAHSLGETSCGELFERLGKAAPTSLTFLRWQKKQAQLAGDGEDFERATRQLVAASAGEDRVLALIALVNELLVGKGAPEEARAALQPFPPGNDPLLLSAWVEVQQQLGELTAARDLLVDAIPRLPAGTPQAAGWWQLGTLHDRLDDAHRAGECWTRAIEAEPPLLAAAEGLIRICVQMREWAIALRWLEWLARHVESRAHRERLELLIHEVERTLAMEPSS